MRKIILILVIFLFNINLFAAEKICVVVNKNNKINEIKISELKQIFLSFMKKWKEGTKINAYNLKANSESRILFQKKILNSTPDKMKDYWIKKRIQGKEFPPENCSSELLVGKFISIKKGGIGYVSEKVLEKMNDKIKSLTIADTSKNKKYKFINEIE
jgi:ABC-type phosphate transport system substrate-binding protein